MNNVFGHRRSGSTFLIHNLNLNFYIDKSIHKCYNDYSPTMMSSLNKSTMNLYSVRDGRDVLVSCFNWYRQQPGLKGYFDGYTFSDFLYGEIPIAQDLDLFKELSKEKNAPTLGQFKDPIGYWVNHVNGYINCHVPNIYFVNHELLLACTSEVLLDIADYFKLESKKGFIVEYPELVGYSQQKSTIGEWRAYFDPALATFFWSKAETMMIKLGFSSE